MATVIHIEINILFLLILMVIAYQSRRSISQQMNRLLFRYTVYGIIGVLILDTIWMLVDGKIFPGAVAINWVVNAVFLGSGVVMGCIWYLYVLETLGYPMAGILPKIVLIPGILFMILNILSIWTGWIFYINEENVYVRGPWFNIQIIGALASLFASLIHLLIFLFLPNRAVPKSVVIRLLSFYIVPVVGTLLAVPFSGMPGTWTSAAVSAILIYMNDQENSILRDSLTGLNNRKNLESTFTAYIRQATNDNGLYVFMFDLNDFKKINDLYGHPAGDQALVEAANLLTNSIGDVRGFIARYGGDEFIMLGFFPDDEYALRFKKRVADDFTEWNDQHDVPYSLTTGIGFSRYEQGMSLGQLILKADENMYCDKRSQKAAAR